MKAKYLISNQYKMYLDRVDLHEESMPEVQRIETKRAFFAAWGQLLILMQNDISLEPEKIGYEALEAMMKEVGEFYDNEVKRGKGE